MQAELIAPCGMNCAICSRHLALENDVQKKGIKIPYCAGCRPSGKKCAFQKRCEKKLLINKKVRFCNGCENFPCESLKRLDNRYRTFFHMSMIDNLTFMKDEGMKKFLKAQGIKWQCSKCGGVVSCHNGICFSCGLGELKNRKKMYRWVDQNGGQSLPYLSPTANGTRKVTK
jgi:Protein of unknown function (DUF3795)